MVDSKGVVHVEREGLAISTRPATLRRLRGAPPRGRYGRARYF